MMKGFGKRVLWDKYIGDLTLWQVQLRQGDSHFWQGVLKVKNLFLSCCKFCVANGKKKKTDSGKLDGLGEKAYL